MLSSHPKIDLPILHLVGEEADRLGLECYVIGGYVRDIFLHRESTDIDVVVVGSGIDLAQAVAKRLGKGAHLSVFKTYGTAQVKRGKIELEFVGARRESYQLRLSWLSLTPSQVSRAIPLPTPSNQLLSRLVLRSAFLSSATKVRLSA